MNDKPDYDDVEFQLSQYLDGQLGFWAKRRMERRLAQDPAMREQLAAYAALEQHLSAAARQELAGVDYGSQRSAIASALERRKLLEARPRRATVVFRPVFVRPALALAAGLLLAVGLWAWFVRPGTGVRPNSVEVTVALVAPAGPATAPGSGEAVMVMRRMEMGELHIAIPDDESGTQDCPPGTVMVSAGTIGAGELSKSQLLIPFPI